MRLSFEEWCLALKFEQPIAFINPPDVMSHKDDNEHKINSADGDNHICTQKLCALV